MAPKLRSTKKLETTAKTTTNLEIIKTENDDTVNHNDVVVEKMVKPKKTLRSKVAANAKNTSLSLPTSQAKSTCRSKTSRSATNTKLAISNSNSDKAQHVDKNKNKLMSSVQEKELEIEISNGYTSLVNIYPNLFVKIFF